jgi:hypothetical protein
MTSLVFRCQFCERRPDPLTQLSLEKTVRQQEFGTYIDAMPERWLVWHGRGIYGPTRYACGNHRGELKALLREQYGMLGWHPWAKGPHPWAGRRGTDRARRLRRTLVAGVGR